MTTLTNLHRRLDRLALDQLREVAADLQTRLEQSERRAADAEVMAEFWQRRAEDLESELYAANRQSAARVAITREGVLGLIPASHPPETKRKAGQP